MLLCRETAATPLRPRPLARRRPPPPATASSASMAVASSAATRRRRTASARDSGAGVVASAADRNQLKTFAAAMTKPVSSPAARRSFDLLRALLPHRFAELCKVHLSFLIDVPPDFLESDERQQQQQQQQMLQTPGRWLRQHVRNSMKMKLQTGKQDQAAPEMPTHPSASAAAAAAAPSDLGPAESLLPLLEPHAGCVEGLFRKCGSASRQRHLLDALATHGASAEAAAGGCSPHDLAGALKASLAGLAEPLLTSRLLPYFQQVGRLTAPDQSDEGRAALLSARRLKGFRLLVQLLPADRRALLGRLLALLCRTGAAPVTRMTPESLGTVFGPALLYPGACAAAFAHLVGALNSAVAFLVRHADSVMLVPDSIAQDADQILRRIRRSPAASTSAFASGSEEVVSLSVRFAEAAGAAASSDSTELDRCHKGVSGTDFTRAQVAALYAAVQAMPDSAKRRRLIRRFNRTNGGLPTASASAGCSSAASDSSSPTVSPPPPRSPQSPPARLLTSSASPPTPLISSPVFGRLFDFPMRCLSPDLEI